MRKVVLHFGLMIIRFLDKNIFGKNLTKTCNYSIWIFRRRPQEFSVDGRGHVICTIGEFNCGGVLGTGKHGVSVYWGPDNPLNYVDNLRFSPLGVTLKSKYRKALEVHFKKPNICRNYDFWKTLEKLGGMRSTGAAIFARNEHASDKKCGWDGEIHRLILLRDFQVINSFFRNWLSNNNAPKLQINQPI